MLFEREGAPKVPTDLLGGAAKPAQPSLARASSREEFTPANTATTYTGEATSEDPLKMLMGQKKTDAPPQNVPAVPIKPVTKADLDNYMADQLPGAANSSPVRTTPATQPTAVAEASRPGVSSGAKATIESRQDIDGVTWYRIRLWDGTDETFHQKRYNDFKEFDTQLRAKGTIAAQVLPELPKGGTLGLRHKLDVGTFNEKRQDGLQKWLEALTRNLKLATVQDFFLARSGSKAPTMQEPQVASRRDTEEDDGAIQWQ